MIFKITDDKKFIEVEKKGAKDETFTDFCRALPDNECRYAVLDVEITTKSGATTNKLIFVAWSDDNASIKPKMLYASSKDALKKALTGINDEFQVHRRPSRRLRRRLSRPEPRDGRFWREGETEVLTYLARPRFASSAHFCPPLLCAGD